MGIAIPQVISEDRASGAQIIDGSLKFDDNYLSRTPGSEGNLRSWTWSAWVKPDRVSGNLQQLFEAKSGGSDYDAIYFTSGQALSYDLYRSSQQALKTTNRVFRDTGWYHIVVVYDAENSTPDDRVRIYVNGERETSFSSSTNPDTTDNSFINDNGVVHQIGDGQAANQEYDGKMSQVYLIDGQALTADSFGFTDPLTNTWRPKKYNRTGGINDGRTWSSDMSGPSNSGVYTGMFDGNFDGYEQATDGNTLTYTPSGGLTANSSIRIYIQQSSGTYASSADITVNGSSIKTGAINSTLGTGSASGWVDIGTTSLTTLTWSNPSGSNNDYRIFAIDVDGVMLIDGLNDPKVFGKNGFYLPMDGKSPIGHDKSNLNPINNGTVWSSFITGTEYGASYKKTNMFDGVATSGTRTIPLSNTSMTWTPPSPIPINSSLRLYCYCYNNVDTGLKINGTNYGNAVHAANGTSMDWYVVPGPPATLTSLEWSTGNAGAEQGAFSAVEVDGVILVDNMFGNGWTPVNFGGSVALNNLKVSGARPILNTTQGGTQAAVGVFGSKEGAFYTATGSTGSGSGYVFDGVAGNNPSFSFIRGATYTFDYSAASGHPLRFSSTDPDSSTTAYTTGTNTATSNVTKFTVPHDAPDNLWYYCTNHSNMNGAISVTTDETKADKYAANCTLALPLVGNDDDVSNSVNCTSTTKVASNSGVDASSAQSNFYNGSHYWGSNSDSLTYAQQGSELIFGTGDYTIEFWFFDDNSHSGTSNRCYLFDNRIGGSVTGDPPQILGFIDNSNEVNFSSSDGSIAFSVDADNRWIHYAAVRSSGTTTLYLDGISVGTVSGSTDYTNNGIGVGRATDSGYGMSGYIQDFRIYKGVAKYTSNFVPAATSPDILPDSPSGVSGSSKLTKITDGAVSFDGSGSYLTVPQSNDYDFTGDYTYEAFIYYTDTSGSPTIFDFSAASSNYEGRLQIQAGVLKIYDGGWQSRGAISANAWHHVAVTQAKVYVDGIDVGASSGSVSGSNYKKPTIGARTNDGGDTYGDFFTGQISNVRIVNGTALYSSNFTPPSNPLTNVTNTKLLCCQSGNNVQTAAVSSQTDSYSAGVYLTAPTYTDRGNSSCTVNNSGSVTSSSAGTNSFGLTNGAAMTGTQKVEIILGNHTPYFFLKAWTLEFYFKTDSVAEQMFIGTLTDGSSWRTGWALDVTAGALKWDYDDLHPGEGKKDLGITISANTWYFCRVQRTPSSPAKTAGNLFVEVYDSPTNLVGSFEGVVADDELHSNNGLKIGDVNDNSSNLTGNWLFANVMITSGYHRRGTVPTLSSGQRAVSTIDGYVSFAASKTGAINFNPYNTDINTVRGQESGYATMNPLDQHSNIRMKDGNLVVFTNSNSWCGVRGTFGNTSGKFYYEVNTGVNGGSTFIGLGSEDSRLVFTTDPQDSNTVMALGTVLYCDNGQKIVDSSSRTSYGDALAAHDLIGVAYDLDNKTVEFFNNGISQGVIDFSSNVLGGVNQIVFPYFINYHIVTEAEFNFGQKPFKFPPPDGFQPLNNANTRPVKVFARPDQYVGAVIYTGNQTARTLSTNFAPDFVWTKRRDDSNSHQLYDSVRGDNKIIQSDGSGVESTVSNSLSFAESKGINIGSGTRSNETGVSYVAWAWKAGGDAGTFNVDDVGYASASDAGLTAGTITPLGASVGTKQGFSIVKFHGNQTGGATVPHGLSQTPDFTIVKQLTGTDESWRVKHRDIASNKTLYLNHSREELSNTEYISGADSTTITLSTGLAGINADADYIMYAWHNVTGLQKFGKYTGDASNNPFIELGFRPALLWIKNISTNSTDWIIIDSQRQSFNSGTMTKLYANTNDSESGIGIDVQNNLDLLSNGFKLRDSNNRVNASNDVYIYCAWADVPTVSLYGAQSNAR